MIRGLTVFGAETLESLVHHINDGPQLEVCVTEPRRGQWSGHARGPDLSEVQGQEGAKRALEIAAAGSHNLLLIGPPGAGKTMLARSLPRILPPLAFDEAMEVSRVHFVAGLLRNGELVSARPFRAPHHSVSYAGLVGGGVPLRPREISFAHNGVLFLDELPEYRRNALETLRQPMEERVVTLSRVRGSVCFPSRFILIAAMNPCPCGFHGDGSDRCLCDPPTVARYRGRVSGPLLDRIDLHVEVSPLPIELLAGAAEPESSAVVADRVGRARRLQAKRFRREKAQFANAHLISAQLRRWCKTTGPVSHLLSDAADRLGLSAPAYDRVLRVSKTIADLDGVPEVREEDVSEALQYRDVRRGRGQPFPIPVR
jgi:magnesium chelatase family protein